jgi:cytochrome bd ubiquinol oxidase subunit II
MESFWYFAVAVMLAAYVFFDGFDLGAGAVLWYVARNNDGRRAVFRAVGPVWDGNEVWLIAAGGALFFAFPLVYASSFSGFYLPLAIVLWLLILRALGIELRPQVDNPLWRSFFDFSFSVSSSLLAVFFGAAFGNVLRGVPLGRDGYFFCPLWTDFRPGAAPGILDWYTVLIGTSTFVILAVHGANYLAVKTSGDVNRRCRVLRGKGLPLVTFLTLAGLLATVKVRPDVLANYERHPVAGVLLPFLVLVSLVMSCYFHVRGRDRRAFASFGVYVLAMLAGAAVALYPMLLPSSTDPSLSLTVYNAAAGEYGLKVGLVWWSIGMVLAMTYFVIVYRMFRGKVD